MVVEGVEVRERGMRCSAFEAERRKGVVGGVKKIFLLGPAVSLEVLLACGIGTVGGRDVGGARITKADPSESVKCCAEEDDSRGSLDLRSGSALPDEVIIRPNDFGSDIIRIRAEQSCVEEFPRVHLPSSFPFRSKWLNNCAGVS